MHTPATILLHPPTPIPSPMLSPSDLATLEVKLRVAASSDALISIWWGLPISHQRALRVNVYGKLMDFGFISSFPPFQL